VTLQYKLIRNVPLCKVLDRTALVFFTCPPIFLNLSFSDDPISVHSSPFCRRLTRQRPHFHTFNAQQTPFSYGSAAACTTAMYISTSGLIIWSSVRPESLPCAAIEGTKLRERRRRRDWGVRRGCGLEFSVRRVG
jgi:hypothetical protein